MHRVQGRSLSANIVREGRWTLDVDTFSLTILGRLMEHIYLDGYCWQSIYLDLQPIEQSPSHAVL